MLPLTEGLKFSTHFPLHETRELSHGQFDFLFFFNTVHEQNI